MPAITFPVRGRRPRRARVVVGVLTSVLLASGLVSGLYAAGPAHAVSPAAAGDGPHAGMSADVEVAPAVVGSNEQAAFAYLQSRGLTAVQAAGVVGNLDQESGMNPAATQSNGGPGRGIAQWEVGARWDTDAGDNVLAYARQRGQSPTSLGLQLDFLWYELYTYPYTGLAELRSASTISAAVTAFQDHFEHCGSCMTPSRVQFAQAAYDQYAAPATPAGTAGSTAVKVGSSYHVFWTRTGDGHLLHTLFTSGWTTEDLGGVLAGAPAVTFHDNRYDVFAAAPNGNLYQKYHTPGLGWTAYRAIAAGWAPGVSAVWNGTRYDVFGHSTTGHLLQAYFAGGAWHVGDLGGNTRGAPGVTFHDNRYDVFSVAADGSLAQTTHTTAGWTGFHTVSTASYLVSSDAGATALWTGSQYHVFAVGSDGTLRRVIYTTSWSTATSLGGTLAKAPGLTYARGRFDVFAPFTGDRLDQNTYLPTTGLTGWHVIA